MTALTRSTTLLKLVALSHRARSCIARRCRGTVRAGRARSDFYRYTWHQAARRIGATVTELGYGILEIALDDRRTRVVDNYTPLDDPVALAVAGNKPLVYRLLARHDIPIPRHATFSLDTLPDAARFLAAARGDCVVKPAADTGAGAGVTTRVRDPQRLAWAAAHAATHCPELVIEDHVAGDHYRVLYVNGVAIDAILRRPPSVMGDGRSSIARLVRRENAVRLEQGFARAQTALTIDLDMKQTLADQGLSLGSIPEAGRIVCVKTVTHQNVLTDNVSAMHRMHPRVLEDGARAAAVVGANLAGIDVLTTDPGTPLEQSGGVILEVNTTPGYYYHYHRGNGMCEVAVRILETLLGLDGCDGAREACAGVPVLSAQAI
jgi:cyanophycin synthetase